MKKIILAATVLFGCLAASGQSFGSDPVFDKRDKKVDLEIGVGTVAYPGKSGTTFDQHFGMEWGVAKIGSKFTLGLGFDINNMYGGQFDGMVVGKYDYDYTIVTTGKRYSFKNDRWESANSTQKVHREGAGSAEAKICREDVDALFVAALHFSPINRLDTYVKLGAGVGVMNYLTGDYPQIRSLKN